HEHRLRSAVTMRAARWRARRRRRLRNWKVDLEHSPVPELAVDPDVPAALLDQTVNGRETETGALALLFRREERLEQALARRDVHAVPRVGDRKPHVSAGNHLRMPPYIGFVELNRRRLDRET